MASQENTPQPLNSSAAPQQGTDPTALTPVDPNQGRRWELSRWGTLAATVVAAVLTATPRIKEIDIQNPLGGDEVTHTQPGVPAGPGTNESQVDGSDGEEQVITREIEAPAERWARLFSGDRDAGKLTGYEELVKVRERIEDCQERGYKVTKVTLEGYASDEDDSVDAQGERTGGLREDALKNRQLGNERARDFRTLLGEDLASNGIEGVPGPEIVAPVEDMVSPEEKRHIGFLAEKFGYADPEDMIVAWNREVSYPEEVTRPVPPAVREYLDEVLAKERKVVVTIECVKSAPSSETSETPSDNPEDPTPPNQTQEPGPSDTFPIYVPLLFFIPIVRRRRTQENNGSVTTPNISITPPVIKPGKPVKPVRPVVVPLGPLGAPKKDAQFKGRPRLMTRPLKVGEERKQPRPLNMFGNKGVNYHRGRLKGGDL